MSAHSKPGVHVQRNDPAAASFYMEAAPWVLESACLLDRVAPEVFFEDIEDARGAERTEAIEAAQRVCASCPKAVRIQCGAEIMKQEGEASADNRWGFRAYMTPEQRESVHRRGGLLGRDPKLLVQGQDGKRRVPPVPIEGDRWSRHHTTLARKVVKYVGEHVAIGAPLPSQTKLCKTLKCNPVPLRRVMDALVQDGTLDFKGRPPGRGRNATTTVYVRRGTPRAVASWLPPHLRTT